MINQPYYKFLSVACLWYNQSQLAWFTSEFNVFGMWLWLGFFMWFHKNYYIRLHEMSSLNVLVLWWISSITLLPLRRCPRKNSVVFGVWIIRLSSRHSIHQKICQYLAHCNSGAAARRLAGLSSRGKAHAPMWRRSFYQLLHLFQKHLKL